ncbi:MAG: glycosyltransferase [Candidatus Omnitrophica bacterium]|nr:glycosyltransferase [Candidatus Omnitrophota bacterium]
MNVLFVNYEYPPVGGGGGVFTKDLAEELAGNNTVHVLTSAFPGLARSETINGVTVFRTPVLNRTSLPSAGILSLLSFPFSGIFKGYSLLKSTDYDVINTHFAVPSGPCGAFLSKISGIPNVLSIHGGDIYDPSKKTSPHRHPLLRWAVKRVMESSDSVIAQSNNTRDNAMSIYSPSKDIKIIPLGIPLSSIPEIDRGSIGLDPDKKYLISIGRLVKRKGYDILIRAFSSVTSREPSTRLILLGSGPELDNLKTLAADLGIGEKISFITDSDDRAKYEYLASSDMYVLSSLHEGFGIVLLEAMACGLSIVSTDNGGQTDILEHEKNALMVPPGDAEALAEAIEELLSSPETMRKMKTNNLEHAKDFSISKVAARYMELFRETINSV